MKASPLLRSWIGRLAQAGVTFRTRHKWLGWDDEGRLLFDTPEGEGAVAVDATVLALGGASWPRLGSTGDWVQRLGEGVGIAPLTPANCGFVVDWTDKFARDFQGQPLKRVALRFGERSVRGEALVTARGIEGGAIYALSGVLRDAIAAGGPALISIDLRPDMSAADIAARLAKPRGKQSLSNFLRKAVGLAPVEIGLLHETAPMRVAEMAPDASAAHIKAVPLRLVAPAGIDSAISTAGGVMWDAVDDHLMLRARPGVFVAGEMLDWEAPTGGYLLQACLATGALAGRGALRWVHRS